MIPAAAALLCVAIAIPVILRGGAKSSGTAAMPASDAATGSACATDDMYMEPACEAASESYYDDVSEADTNKKNAVNSYTFNIQGNNSTEFAISKPDGDRGETAGAVVEEVESEADYFDESSDEAQQEQLVLVVSVDKSLKRAEIEKLAETLDFDIAEAEDEENSYIFTSRRPYETKEVIGITEYLMEFKGITGVRIESGDVR